MLDGVSGVAKAGSLLAIMGPSGAGKTTLLSALAGQLPKNKHMRLTGRLGYTRGAAARGPPRLGFVTQDDTFFTELTVRETLALAAALRLPEASAAEQARLRRRFPPAAGAAVLPPRRTSLCCSLCAPVLAHSSP